MSALSVCRHADDLRAALLAHDVVVLDFVLPASPPQPGAGDEQMGSAAALLSAAERARAAAMGNREVRHRFTAARARLRGLLAAALEVEPCALVLVEGAHGKPALGGRYRGALGFNVSHAEGRCAVALSVKGEVGVDVERVRPLRDWRRVAARVLTPPELDALERAAADAGVEERFFGEWCRVEAELKAVGCGIAGLDERRRGVSWPALHVQTVPLAEPGYVCAVALWPASATASTWASPSAISPVTTPASASTA